MTTQEILAVEADLESICYSRRTFLDESLSSTLNGPVIRHAVLRLKVPANLRLHEAIWLGIASWYLGDSGWLLRDQLTPYAKRFWQVRLACASKEAASCVIGNSFSASDYFGNHRRYLLRILAMMRVKTVKRPVARRLERRRGHRDSNSGRKRLSTEKEYQLDWQSTSDQLRLEELREVSESLFHSFWGGTYHQTLI